MEEEAEIRTEGARYELLGELAAGGMAVVYLGRQRGLYGFTRTVAIKSMHAQYARDPEYRQMFLDEANISGRIRHPNVVPTLDVAASTNKLLLVMEYVEGASVANLLRAAGTKERLPLPVVGSIVLDLLDGLEAAHELKDDDGAHLGVVHRDVSPHNIIVGVDGLARVLDFGVAKAGGRQLVTRTGEVKGKVAYMPPEQLFAESIDRRADLYAAGVVLWELLAGRRLFDAPTEPALIKLVTENRVSPPSRYAGDLPEGLDALVLKALSADPEKRFASAAAMAKELAALLPRAARGDVGDVVKRLAKDELANRGNLMKTGAKTSLDDDAEAVLAVLTKSEMRAATRRSGKRASFALALLGVLGVAGLIGVVAFTRAGAAPPPPVVAAEPPPAVTSVAPVVSAAPEPSIAITVAAPVVPVVAPETAKSALPIRRVTPAPSVVASVAAPATKPDCTLPYTTDAEGRRHYRAECLR